MRASSLHRTERISADDALMACIAKGDQAAFRQLTDRHRGSMTALAKRMTASAADADEIVQETYLKIWMAAPDWRSGGTAQFSTWLYRVVTNACLDRRRKRTFSSLDEAEEVADPRINCFEDVIATERRRVIFSAMTHLPRRQRAAISLHYFAELTTPEAAKVLGVSVPSVESLLFRAKQGMRQALMLAGALSLFDLL